MLLIGVWAALVTFIILVYILLDGFDLGVGILFPFAKKHEDRDLMMASIAPVWDGNETWLVFGAAGLYAAFPLAYGVLLPMLYMPIMIMLLALIFRGVAFEFRSKANKSRFVWDVAFFGGSFLAALMQGVLVGTFAQGFGNTLPLVTSSCRWITPFTLFTGFSVVLGYSLLGASWLIIKTKDELQDRMYKIAHWLLGLVVICAMLFVSWPLLMKPEGWENICRNWFVPPYCYFFLLSLIFFVIIAGCHAFCLSTRYFEVAPFLLSLGLFICPYIGLGIGSWPYAVPHVMTVWEAAAPPSSLKFTLVGVAILLPILLGYTAFAYRVFRGKVKQVDHY